MVDANESKNRFPYEQSQWHNPTDSPRWLQELERLKPEKVRQILTGTGGPLAAITIGTVRNMTKGFAQDWLAWKDEKKSAEEIAARKSRDRWNIWRIVVATAVPVVGAITWVVAHWAAIINWVSEAYYGIS